MVTLKSVGDGFALYGSTVDTIEFVCSVNVGRLVDGIRYISVDECSEALLAHIESLYGLLVWV